MKSMFSPIAFLALSLLAVPDTLNALTHQTDEDRASEVQMNSGARKREVPASHDSAGCAPWSERDPRQLRGRNGRHNEAHIR